MRLAFTLVTILLIAPASNASIIWFLDNAEPWKSATGAHSMIDFTGWPDWTTITDEFAGEGLQFANFVQIHNSESYPDGSGLIGWDGIRIVLDTPHHAVAVDFLGFVSFALYNKGTLVGHIEFGNPFLDPRFVGIISEQSFDEVYLFKPEVFSNSIIAIDNLYWGMPIPLPGVLSLFALGFLAGTRRRCR